MSRLSLTGTRALLLYQGLFIVWWSQLGVCEARKNFSFINPEVDEALRQGPDWLYDLIAILAIVLGVVFAFFGLKTVRLQSTFYGACIAGGLASFVLYLIPGEESAEVWLAVVITSAVIFGYLIGRIVIIRKITLFLVFAATIAGVFNQYALSYFTGIPDWIIWTVIALSIVVSALFIWRYFHISAILATAFIGGFIVLLGTARLTRGQISLIGMWVDPDFMASCVELSCWIPFFAGAGTFALGSIFQLLMRRRQKRLKKISDQPGLDDEEDVTQEPTYVSRQDDPYHGNPFAPEPTPDPLIVELTRTLDSREKKKKRVGNSNDLALA